MEPKIRKPYPEKPYKNPFFCTGESRTKQADAAACDINNLMKRYEKTGVLEHMQNNPGRYEDLPMGLDYHAALNLAITAKESFDALPGTLRAKFGNDVETFLNSMSDPANEKELIELGLLEREEVLSTESGTDLESTSLEESTPDNQSTPE